MKKTTRKTAIVLTCLMFLLLFTTQAFALWRYNPFTQKLDYYEEGFPTAGAAGDITYYDGANWQILTAGANGLVLTLNAGLPTWMAAGAGDMLRATYDVDLDGDIDTAAGGLEVDSSAWTDYVYVTAGIWAVDPVMGKLPAGITITANADVASHQLGGTDYTINWSDGSLILITDEGANSPTTVAVKPKGTSEVSTIELYDTNEVLLSLLTAADRSYIEATTGALGINPTNALDVYFGESSGAGENLIIGVYGYITADTTAHYGYISMDDTNDEFVFGVENDSDIEGITLDLAETNQRFRIRQNADIGSIYMDGTDMQFHTTDGTFVFDSDEAAAEAAIVLYDDDTNYVTIQSQEMAGNWVFTFPATDGAANDVLYDSDGSGTMAYATATSLVAAATTGAAGKVELATTAETSGGTDTARAITADGLAGSTIGRKTMILKVMAEDTVVTSGDGKMYFTVPVDLNGWDLTAVGAHVYTADTGADHIHIDIYNLTDTADMLSAAMQIEDGEKDTATSATPGTINGATDDVATADEIRIDVTTYAGSSAKGLEIRLTFEKQV